jgi:hypothetical protein
VEHYSNVKAFFSITVQFNFEGPSGLEGLIKHDILTLILNSLIAAYKEKKA